MSRFAVEQPSGCFQHAQPGHCVRFGAQCSQLHQAWQELCLLLPSHWVQTHGMRPASLLLNNQMDDFTTPNPLWLGAQCSQLHLALQEAVEQHVPYTGT